MLVTESTDERFQRWRLRPLHWRRDSKRLRRLIRLRCLSSEPSGRTRSALITFTFEWVYSLLAGAHRRCEFASRPERMRRCKAEWKIFLGTKKKTKLFSNTNLCTSCTKTSPGPFAPPATSRPKRKITARSYSCTTFVCCYIHEHREREINWIIQKHETLKREQTRSPWSTPGNWRASSWRRGPMRGKSKLFRKSTHLDSQRRQLESLI